MRHGAFDVVLAIAGVALIAGIVVGTARATRQAASSPSPETLAEQPQPALPSPQPAPARPGTSSSEPSEEDLRLYREALADVEATAHARSMSVAELAAANGMTRNELIAWTYGLKKARQRAVEADRKAIRSP